MTIEITTGPHVAPARRPSLFLVAAVTALIATPVAIAAVAYRPAEIPNAAAEEARIVCANFSGLDRFTVESQGAEAAADGTLHRYRITATCTSQHQVTGTIAIKG